MKMKAIQTDRNTFDFTQSDFIVNYAVSNALKIRGHTLVWYQSIPSWMSGQSFTREELITILDEQITAVVSRYKGKIFCWDVVNEAINDDGSYRQNLYYDTIGPEYIEIAFRAAHLADPDTKLYYNDYGNEGLSTKSTAIYNMVKDLKDNDVPIDGVGFQTHTTTALGIIVANVNTNIQRLAAAGLSCQFTEIDIAITPGNNLTSELALQADVYRNIINLAINSGGWCDSFVMWGITDKYTWLGTEKKPLLFDENYLPKLAYEEVKNYLIYN